jgi:uncharacterized damage-inducible protein DinB
MTIKQNFELMAKYNQWMNEQVYKAAADLSHAQLIEDRGAFFGSILGSLNHILVGDTIWLKRFATHPSKYNSLDYVDSLPKPSALSETLYPDFNELQKARIIMDAVIVNFSLEASEQDYEHELSFNDTKGQPFNKKFGFLVHHFYNHQTHHRGQVTTLLSQLGIDVGVTDLLTLIPLS